MKSAHLKCNTSRRIRFNKHIFLSISPRVCVLCWKTCIIVERIWS